MTTRRLAVIGDGKMGRTVARLAGDSGWTVAAIIGEGSNAGGKGITPATLNNAQVAIEFTEPSAAVGNITACLRAGCPVVAGTTGWYDELPSMTRLAEETKSALLWSANFSLGVNVMIELARHAGELMRATEGFDAHIVETHHSAKKDAPSGTAIQIERAVREGLAASVPVTSIRTGSVPGTHEIVFDAMFEQLTLTHNARDRSVFAAGALRAAGWLIGRKGVFTMRDVLSLPAGG